MKRPIILHIISDLGIGGAEKQLLLLLPTLQSSYDNRVVCLRGPALTGKALVDKDIPVTYLNRKLPFSPGIFLSITKTINKLKPDIVVGYLVEADVISRFACHNKNVAYVSSQRSSLVHHPFLASLNKTTKRLADFFTVHTRARKTELINSWKISPSKIFIIPNTVITPPTNKNNLVPTDNSLNIICVANFKKGKGHSLLLKAFNNLHKQHPNIRLLIMGKGPIEKPIRRQICEYA
ncbi:MAG: glycosyltransferase, partial [Candidatus Binatia bacterium]|nr:glycosyltransferase [Candidatus Binatia bacterium]